MNENFDFATAYDMFCQKSVKRFSIDMGKVKHELSIVFMYSLSSGVMVFRRFFQFC